MRRPLLSAFILLLLTLLPFSPSAALHAQQNQTATSDDSQTDANVMSALGSAKSLSDVAINTTTVNGVVTLTGVVSNQSQKELAELLTSHAAGVKSVVNQLTVSNPTATSPRQPDTPGPRQSVATGSPSDVSTENATQQSGELLSDGSFVPTAPAAPAAPAKKVEAPLGPIVDINVDQKCRVLVVDTSNSSTDTSHPHYSKDPAICQIRGVHDTRGYVESIENGVVKRTHIQVKEQTYVLQNMSTTTIAYRVHHQIANGWRIDSQPQPAEVVNNVAIFRVVVRPGEVQKLHVGERR